MKNRKSNRMKGFDFSSNNLYFVTNCVKNNVCCLGRVCVGTGRDLSVHHPEKKHAENHHAENHHPEKKHAENHHAENHHPEKKHADNHHPENHHPENHHPEIEYKVELNQYGLIVDEKINWLMSQYEYVAIHNYCIMPNHFH